MKKFTKNLIKSALKQFDIGVTRYTTLEKLRKNSSPKHNLELLQQLINKDNAEQILQYFNQSKSQLGQDLFVLSLLGFKRNGYFVEFGATNGVNLSNTYLMEKEFDWNGIVAEPAKCWHRDLKNNRSCNIEIQCVWKDSTSTLSFNETDYAELSTINLYSDSDLHETTRKNGKIYDVKTISLNDLLEKYDAPKKIDYLSIDTEGSEYEILTHFNFSRYQIDIITCEHNHTPMRDRIYLLLQKKGYRRVFSDLSDFDDWYIHSSISQLGFTHDAQRGLGNL